MDKLNVTKNATGNGLGEALLIYNTLGVVGCLLNGFVCVIIGSKRSLRQPFNHLILNLSVANFVLSFAIILYGLTNYLAAILILRNLSLALADVLCKLDLFCLLSSLMATCLTLFAISIERYQAVAIVHIHDIELSTIRKVIVFIWIIACVSAIIPTYFAGIDSVLLNSCYVSQIRSTFLVIVNILLFFVSSVLPVSLMLITYITIIYKLYSDIQVPSSTLSPEAYRRKKGLQRSIIAIIFISILSAGSRVPYIILNVILITGHHYQEGFNFMFFQQNALAWNIFGIMFMFTPTINPLLYNLASSQFRDALYQLFCSRCHCHHVRVFTTTREPIKDTEIMRTRSTKDSQQLPHAK